MLATFQKIFPEKILSCEKLPQSGSHREYYRLKTENQSYIGVLNENIQENKAFIDYTRQLKKIINVPEIIVPNWGKSTYIIDDLGDVTLLSIYDKKGIFDTEMEEYYKRVLGDLYKVQTELGNRFDFSEACEKTVFDKDAILFDLNYFKYYFLKLAGIKYNEEKLQKDFEKFADDIVSLETDVFCFRDFHAGNIMLKDNKLYYIDYQGGRLGNRCYDLASLLYSGKTKIPEKSRKILLSAYPIINIRNFYMVSLLRIMQAMGSYGFRGYFERKERFLKSIPNAVKNVETILTKLNTENTTFSEYYPVLFACFQQIRNSISLDGSQSNRMKKSDLTVEISSFSYKTGIPKDESGNGGGFVFDCRFLQNPGRYDQFKDKNSRDHQEVRDFLNTQPAVAEFLDNVWQIVQPAVQNYVDRNFEHLQINFGCTGGQHRSVYCAEKIAERLRRDYDITIIVKHLQL
ncbi:phosphotransferase [Bacteroidia bacterium]|nr:phosphotransferase [Bacteroidia bacterium]